MSEFTIKDSGERQAFDSGMVRDTTEGKTNFLSCRFGPMFRRWNDHLTKGRAKYPDPAPGVPNWTLAAGEAELLRARESAARHFEQWLAGDVDEDHAAALFFNINLAEYVRERLADTAEALFYTPEGLPEGWCLEECRGKWTLRRFAEYEKPQPCCGDPGDCGNYDCSSIHLAQA